MNTPTYHLTEIKKFYNSNRAVYIEDLSIPESSITGLVGPNGSGKSTLLNMLAFIDRPSEGTILFKGQKAEPYSDIVRFRVSLLAQEPYLLKRSVYENVAYGLKLRGGNPSRYPEQVNESLALVGLSPREFSNRPWYGLSGGEAQRVALAARLVLKPEVLILDEPTASVDADSAGRIMDCAMMASKEWGTTLIIASHDWKWLHEICGNVLQMFKGKIIGNSMENIIFGPWNQNANRFWEKELEDGQRIRVPAPPSPSSAAIIQHGSISLTSQSPILMKYEHSLHGVIAQLSLEPSTNAVMVSIRAGSQTFMLRISQDEARETAISPGQKMYISYPLSAVTWY
ncbi:MAG: ATP-binding cassette domain-containing protein [Desulfobacteraceae bacterium]|nr:MAG: ATP-binding cassette domain-containing protein [Desulfobacteraceae bacterium]